MIEKLMNMIKVGINRGIDDTGKFQRGFFTWLGRDVGQKQKAWVFTPYGTFGCPTEDLPAVMQSIGGADSNIVAFVAEGENRIKKGCKPGEYGIGNSLTKANIYFKEDGSVSIEVPDGEFVIDQSGDYTLNIDGNVTINSTGKVSLGTDGLNPLQGVVTGECLDPVTGVPFPDKSAFVFARKT